MTPPLVVTHLYIAQPSSTLPSGRTTHYITSFTNTSCLVKPTTTFCGHCHATSGCHPALPGGHAVATPLSGSHPGATSLPLWLHHFLSGYITSCGCITSCGQPAATPLATTCDLLWHLVAVTIPVVALPTAEGHS